MSRPAGPSIEAMKLDPMSSFKIIHRIRSQFFELASLAKSSGKKIRMKKGSLLLSSGHQADKVQQDPDDSTDNDANLGAGFTMCKRRATLLPTELGRAAHEAILEHHDGRPGFTNNFLPQQASTWNLVVAPSPDVSKFCSVKPQTGKAW